MGGRQPEEGGQERDQGKAVWIVVCDITGMQRHSSSSPREYGFPKD